MVDLLIESELESESLARISSNLNIQALGMDLHQSHSHAYRY